MTAPREATSRYHAREAASPADLEAVLALRALCFRGAVGHDDSDAFDALCTHIMIEDRQRAAAGQSALVCCFRILPLSDGHDIARSYAAQFYDLSALSAFRGPMIELGRFCIHPDAQDPDILRVAWADLTRRVDREGVEMLFGCSSFNGTEATAHADAFALLSARHIAPQRWRPRIKAPNTLCLGSGHRPDRRRAMAAMPPLLRTYLKMGGWVSDHAVVDRDLDTLHVFTGLEIAAIPAARKRLLRAAVG